MTYTYTYAELEVSEAVYEEIAEKLRAAGWDQAFHKRRDGTVVIDMHGVGLVTQRDEPSPETRAAHRLKRQK